MAHVAHFSINADDLERAKKFYGDVFGWSYQAFGPPGFYMIQGAGGPGNMYASIQSRRCPGCVEADLIGIGNQSASPPIPGNWADYDIVPVCLLPTMIATSATVQYQAPEILDFRTATDEPQRVESRQCIAAHVEADNRWCCPPDEQGHPAGPCVGLGLDRRCVEASTEISCRPSTFHIHASKYG